MGDAAALSQPSIAVGAGRSEKIASEEKVFGSNSYRKGGSCSCVDLDSDMNLIVQVYTGRVAGNRLFAICVYAVEGGCDGRKQQVRTSFILILIIIRVHRLTVSKNKYDQYGYR